MMPRRAISYTCRQVTILPPSWARIRGLRDAAKQASISRSDKNSLIMRLFSAAALKCAHQSLDGRIIA
eukprot:1979445-Pleurochrysis_carterae.AAC.5